MRGDRFWLGLVVVGAIGGLGNRALAQSLIVPDESLGGERSVIISLDANGFPIDVIAGGSLRGLNLFHSFREFNINVDRGAYFRNRDNKTQNILARVTGSNRSEILGTLGVVNGRGITSQPNLFLINPNGVIFGSSAALDVAGSFVTTTANAVQFSDQGVFDTVNADIPGLLNINPSALLFNQVSRPAEIIVQSSRGIPILGDFINPRFQPINILPDRSIIPSFPGLQVGDQKTLALVGGDILLSNSALSVDGGRIELGSIDGAGDVSLIPVAEGFVLGYEKISNFGKIKWESSIINANGLGGGSLQIRAAYLLTTADNSFSGISAQTQGDENGGEILIRADKAIQLDNAAITATVAPLAKGKGNKITIETLNLSLNGGDSSILTRNFGNNQAGDILIQSQELTLSNGAGVLTSALGSGNAGNLTIQASKFIDVSGTTIFNEEKLPGGLQADIMGTGTGGSVLIKTPRLIVRDGATVSARTNNGTGGRITINASESVELLNGGSIKTQTFGRGNAGSIIIETKRLKTTVGSEITASAGFRSQGNAGNIRIVATDTVELVGVGGIIAAVLGGAGEGGNLSIDTKSLILREGGTVSSEAITRTRGGNIYIFADLVEVNGYDPRGFSPSQITTRTASLNNDPSGDIIIDTRQINIQDGGDVQLSVLQVINHF
jgi:filamentous hemagglutinin family protein